MSLNLKNKGINTLVTHAGENPDTVHGSVGVPIYQTSTFKFQDADHGARLFGGEEKGYIYTRIGNPTTNTFEEAVALLEHGFGGIATASGMAAVSSVYMTYLGAGAHMVGTDAVYGSSRMVVENDFSRFGVESSFVDTSDLDLIRRSMKPNTKLLYIETPANPTIKLADIEACAEIAHEHGAVLVVDNTFMSPVLQNPLDLGADVVLHSITKYINGHTDVVGGVIVTKTEEDFSRLKSVINSIGGTMDPHQSWLVLRGMRTLSLRVQRGEENAHKLADYLEAHPKIEWVRYPGLKSHPQHDLAVRQMKGFGSMISFEVKGGLENGKTVLNNVKIPQLAVSLGGYESLIQHPASMTHANIPEDERVDAGITDGLVRLAVGTEDVEDLQADLEQALALI
ncbi:MAG: PLP-dependent transferase [Candidatus Marinimicrobia bacterium]|jgi:methionine-gamma-lyase|nr:PLP-dependent transferase [Candidatus Neomarinimicrobiota bacterium]MBT3631056.1 PLP-dependent transferase [Candidatus Neomarinimicrobiota bacterium]MBT3825696.1 PLP-dependent transferase [Candidatus Neomarinimicrobiota bacterium]MBT4130560.1 PLP-dependent transferase [Candidatus Neomarinimicrobiota bacterium]MBT4296219.1 PLP-dependent transferase [Candidatus Neomarinimicrobiota bacterium]